MDEFNLIKTYFTAKTPLRSDVVCGIGDDAALMQFSPQQLLVTAMDTLVEAVHFPKQTAASDVGYKALAVNLSDFAAMGAEPAWFTLALTIPTVDVKWLDEFSMGLFALASPFNLQLVGGDTTRGPLSITIQVLGVVPENQALLRSSAQVGDKIYVTGTLGDAGLGLQVAFDKIALPEASKQFILNRLNRPEPRLQAGKLLRGLASSAIDISDGLLADLDHILLCSQVGAIVWAEELPLSSALSDFLPKQQAQQLALTAGDDYELCFTVPVRNEKNLIAQFQGAHLTCTCIGEIVSVPGIQVSGFAGVLPQYGFQHFK